MSLQASFSILIGLIANFILMNLLANFSISMNLLAKLCKIN